ncbi:MAG: hypothetical protein ACM67Z_01680 [Clostridiales bacterium]
MVVLRAISLLLSVIVHDESLTLNPPQYFVRIPLFHLPTFPEFVSTDAVKLLNDLFK